ncbi:MAG: CoA-transferase subunit beta [Sneathiellaceae bacterium]
MSDPARADAQAVSGYSADEMMSVAASRLLDDRTVCFVGIGLPSEAANLARLIHAPNAVLIYESGTIGTRPDVLPLSIGDGELADTARTVVSVPEMFRYWLQGGRIDVGFLGAAQIDRWGNINTTVIGPYDKPRTRLPGAGGAPEIATSSGRVYVILRQSPRAFVEELDFVTSLGGGPRRQGLAVPGAGPQKLITDLGILEPHPETGELTLTALHPGATVEQAKAKTGWALQVADRLTETPVPSAQELEVLRALKKRTAEAHSGDV